METGFHMRAFDSQFLPETGWMSSILGNSITKNTSSFLLLKAIKLASDLLLSHPLLISIVFTLGQEEEEIHLWTPSEPNKLDCKLPEGKDPCLSCFPHGLEYNTGTQLWRKNKDNRIGSKAVTLPDISCFYVNAMTPCNFFPLNKTNFSKIKKKKSHVSWHILHFDSYSRAECLIVLNDQGVSGTFFFFRKRNSTVAKCTLYHISRVWETGISQLKVICSDVYLP